MICPECKKPIKVSRLSPPSSDTIRGDYIPHSKPEAEFKEICKARGWKPHRPSWPDYLVETQLGEILLVEVKGSDTFSYEQRLTLSLLEKMGLNVFVWKNKAKTKGEILRWKDGLALKKINKILWEKKKPQRSTRRSNCISTDSNPHKGKRKFSISPATERMIDRVIRRKFGTATGGVKR